MFEQSSRPLKVALSVLFVATLAVLVLVILMQNGLLGKKTETTVTPAATSQPQKTTPTVPASLSPSALLKEETPKQIKDLQAQIDAGTLTPEEAKKQLEALNAQAGAKE